VGTRERQALAWNRRGESSLAIVTNVLRMVTRCGCVARLQMPVNNLCFNRDFAELPIHRAWAGRLEGLRETPPFP
jgi:hypothetical protein